MTGGNAIRNGQPVTPPGPGHQIPPQTPPPRQVPPAPSPYTAAMAMFRTNRMEMEKIAREKAELQKREDDLKERDDTIKDLVQRFQEWTRLGSEPDTKPAVDDEMLDKLIKWLKKPRRYKL